MSKRFIITEQEKNDIKKLYNINEGFFDNAFDFVSDLGKDVKDFFTDVFTDEENKESEEITIEDIKKKLSDENLSNDEKNSLEKKLKDLDYSPNLDEYDNTEYQPVKLFKKIEELIDNKKLALALVSNAFGESRFKCTAKGDGGDYAQSSNKSLNIGGKKYCSFGLWQFNICGGLGISYLKEYNIENGTPEKKLELLMNCDKQVEFMVKHVKEKTKSVSKKKNVKDWVEWIVYNIERPSDKSGATSRRSNWASKNYIDFGFTKNEFDSLDV